MRREIPNPSLDQACFFCGAKNRGGLKLRFYVDEETGDAVPDDRPASQYGAKVFLAAKLEQIHGTVCATDGGTCHLLPQEKMARLIQRERA